jgi:hypothetical protein
MTVSTGPEDAKAAKAAKNRRTNKRNLKILGGVVGAFFLIGILGSIFGDGDPKSVADDQPSSSVTSSSSSSTTSSAPSSTTSPSSPTATPSTPKSSAPAPTGRAVVLAAGVVLPNRTRTPGALNPMVTQGNIDSTICVSGWTSTVRPSSSVTTALKKSQLASGYAYRGDLNPSNYEEDHLISLELGGSPSSPKNLWPEPYAASRGAHTKDTVENKLHALVCSRQVTLATAQQAIASNWWAAYKRYVGATKPQPKPSASTTSSSHPSGATALCNDGTYSYAAHHQGACSRHKGVAVFYK